MRILVAIDGSEHSARVIDYVIAAARRCSEPFEVELLNVQLALVGVNVKLFVRREDLDAYYRDEGLAVLAGSREKLESAGITHRFHIGVGNPAEVIAQYVEELQCAEVVMGTRGLGTVSSLVLGSVTTKVIHLVNVPVVLIQ